MSSCLCRLCGGDNLLPVLSLGQVPLANALVAANKLGEPDPTYPLELVFCESCSLVHLSESVPPEELFSEYLYFSSFSDTLLEASQTLAHRLVEERGLSDQSLAIDIASNDGYLLRYYQEKGVPVLGIDPAENVVRAAEANGVPTVCGFFGLEMADGMRDEGRLADVIHANNVLAHVPDLNGFLKGASRILKPEGVFVVEVPYVKHLIERTEFDTIYHEHLCYFSLTALDRAFSSNGLTLSRVEHIPAHGGSLRVFAGLTDSRDRTVTSLLQEEADWGVADHQTYADFGQKVRELKTALLDLLSRLKSEGGSIAAYGAPAKATTLLNYLDVGPETVAYTVDRSEHKQGRFIPGVRVPIHPPEKLTEDQPDYALLMVWNLADEIIRQQQSYVERGGKFVVPIPEPRIV